MIQLLVCWLKTRRGGQGVGQDHEDQGLGHIEDAVQDPGVVLDQEAEGQAQDPEAGGTNQDPDHASGLAQGLAVTQDLQERNVPDPEVARGPEIHPNHEDPDQNLKLNPTNLQRRTQKNPKNPKKKEFWTRGHQQRIRM